MEHYFFSYLLTCEVYLIEVSEIMAQMLQYITFLSLKSIEVSSDFILNYLKKVIGGATNQKNLKTNTKTMISSRAAFSWSICEFSAVQFPLWASVDRGSDISGP